MVTENKKIDWHLISDAINFYINLGYSYVETPWLISRESSDSTFSGEPHTILDGRCLPGSAEQSFFQLMNSGKLKAGKYVSCGPCYRKEPVLDELHQETFFKVELIHVLNCGSSKKLVTDSLRECLRNAYTFFHDNCENYDLLVRYEKDQVDIVLNEVEVGSYGSRSLGSHTWIYGTGLAEPRFSIANAKAKNHNFLWT